MSVDTQLASAHAGVLHLVELAFTTGTVRLTNWSHPIDWAGFTWAGSNCITSVSPVKVSEGNEYPAMDLGVYPSNSGLLATALGAATVYRGRPVTIYQAVLDDQLRAVGDPELAWYGLMSQVRVNTGDGEKNQGSIVMRCELPGRDTRAVRSLRLNNAQHQRRFPGDTLLSRVEQLTGQPVPWLSRRFQQI